MRILAVIAARAGSKGLPNKNIRDLSGKPLIVYTIEQVKKWGKYDKFIISTDSKVIADLAGDHGVDVPFIRPAELAADRVGKVEALRHALGQAEKYYNMSFDALLDLDVTAPVRTVGDIDNIVNLFKEKKADTVFSVVKAHRNPYFNMVEKAQDGTFKLCKQSAFAVLARQGAPVVYELNASLYVYKREFLLNPGNKTAISKKSFAYEMGRRAAVDIDCEDDFKYIEFLIKQGLVRL